MNENGANQGKSTLTERSFQEWTERSNIAFLVNIHRDDENELSSKIEDIINETGARLIFVKKSNSRLRIVEDNGGA